MIGYPVLLVRLERALVVGGGSVAARKVAGLRAAGARVAVVSPALGPELNDLAARGEIEWIDRAYQPGDLAGADLVIAATDDPAVNEQVWQEAREQGILVNVVDDPAHCTFTVPAIVRQGDLTLAVSTNGRAPALARYVRERLEEEFGPSYGRLADFLGRLREQARAAVPSSRRESFWQELLRSAVPGQVLAGDEPAALRLSREIMERYTEPQLWPTS